MRFIKLSIFIFGFISLAAFANEGGEAGGEGGEGGAKKKQEKTAAVEYLQKTTKLNTIQSRIQDSQKEFEHLTEEKEHEKDQKKIQEMLKEMVEVAKRRNKDVTEYNQVRQELLYKYP